MRIAVQILAWNGANFFPDLFKSLKNQTYKDFEVYILDNGSSDDSLEIIKNEASGLKLNISTSKENIGFAPGHNLLFSAHPCEFVLLLNQDVVLEPNAIENLVNHLERNANCGSVGLRLMRLQDGVKTEIIDSLGLSIKRSRRAVDKEAGKIWIQRNGNEMVFGISGALVLLRRSAVEKAGGLFHNWYFSYQEDIDLAWRLQLAGFSSEVILNTVSYHNRSGREAGGILQSALNKKNQSKIIRFHSYKNHLALLYRNEQWQNFILDLPWILWYELGKFTYFLFTDPKVISGAYELVMNRKKLSSEVRGERKVDWKYLRKWWI